MDANRAVRPPAALVNRFTSIQDTMAGTGRFRNPRRDSMEPHEARRKGLALRA